MSVRVQRMDEDGEVYEDETLRSEGMLELWDVQRGALVRRFDGVGHDVRTCALSRDSRFALSGAIDEPLRLWDVASGSCLLVYSALHYGCHACAFADDGAIVAVGRDEAHIISLGGAVLHVTALSFDPWAGYALSPDGRFLIGCVGPTRAPIVAVWDTLTGERIMAGAIKGATDMPQACALSADGRLALVVRYHFLDTLPEIWDVATGGRVATLHGEWGFPRACALSPEGERVLVASDNGMRLWDVVTGDVVRAFSPSSATYAAHCTFSPDGTMAAASGYQDAVNLWTVEENPHPAERHTDDVTVWALSADGTRAISGSQDRTLRLWDLATGQTIRSFVGHSSGISDCAIHPGGREFVSASLDGTLRVWEMETGLCHRVLTAHREAVTTCTFSPGGRSLLSSGLDGNLFLWDWGSGEVVRLYTSNEVHSLYHAATFAADGRSVAASTNWHVYVWPVERVRPVVELSASEAHALAFSPDSRLLAAGDKDGGVLVWDLNTGGQVHALDAHAWSARGLTFSPDGRTLASAHCDGVLCLWDIASGVLRAQWNAPSSLESCRFSDDGLRVSTGDAEGNLHHLAIRAAGV